MRKFLLLISLVFIGNTAQATNPFEEARQKVGGVLDYWKYREPGLMEDSGALLGVEYEFRNVAYEKLAYQFNAEFLFGKTNYEGADLNTGSPLAFEQTNMVGMVQFFMGPLIETSGRLIIIPKLGLLYRKLIDRNDEFAGDYQRDQVYTVIPLGIDFVLPLDSGAQWIFSVWQSIYFKGQNKTYLTDVGGDRDLTFDQDDGSGAEVSVTYSKDWWYVSAVIRAWQVDDSEMKVATVPSLTPPTNTFLEPENETASIGGRFGLRF